LRKNWGSGKKSLLMVYNNGIKRKVGRKQKGDVNTIGKREGKVLARGGPCVRGGESGIGGTCKGA